jgi:hypothetical protein
MLLSINNIFNTRLKYSLKAAAWHLFLSLLVAFFAGVLVFGVWYPYPYRELSGGRELFVLIISVDVVCGPLLTFVLFNPAKPRSELVRDLGIVAMIQMAALVYGLYTVSLARPVYVVHEVDRLRVVSRADIPEDQLKPELGGFHILPLFGPKLIGVREAKNATERATSLDLAFQGQDVAVRPDWWQKYDLSRDQVLSRAKPVANLRSKRPTQISLIDQAVVDSGVVESKLLYIPLTSFKTSDWVAFIDAKTGVPLAYAPIDGF